MKINKVNLKKLLKNLLFLFFSFTIFLKFYFPHVFPYIIKEPDRLMKLKLFIYYISKRIA